MNPFQKKINSSFVLMTDASFLRSFRYKYANQIVAKTATMKRKKTLIIVAIVKSRNRYVAIPYSLKYWANNSSPFMIFKMFELAPGSEITRS